MRRLMGDTLSQQQKEILDEIQNEETKAVEKDVEIKDKDDGAKQIKEKPKKKKRVEKAEAKTEASTAKASPVPTDIQNKTEGIVS